MLEIKSLTKTFGKNKKAKTAVKELNFTVSPGEIVGLLGENGAGKTTTLRMISTMLKVTSGQILVNGLDVMKEPSKVRNEIAILFGGDVALYDKLTGRENIMYFANLYGLSKEVAEARTLELATDLGMLEYLDKPVGKYSRGMKQKVMIARSIVHDPKVILFDEPTTGLDVRAARVIQQFIKKCKTDNKIVLFSSHSMVEIERLCDRAVIINHGTLLENCTLSELKRKHNKEDLEEIFVDLIGGEDNE